MVFWISGYKKYNNNNDNKNNNDNDKKCNKCAFNWSSVNGKITSKWVQINAIAVANITVDWAIRTNKSSCYEMVIMFWRRTGT